MDRSIQEIEKAMRISSHQIEILKIELEKYVNENARLKAHASKMGGALMLCLRRYAKGDDKEQFSFTDAAMTSTVEGSVLMYKFEDGHHIWHIKSPEDYDAWLIEENARAKAEIEKAKEQKDADKATPEDGEPKPVPALHVVKDEEAGGDS